jgi:hypothetical protein
MAGLSHYQNSISAMNKFEPVFLNQFEVNIIPPSAIPGGEILLQHVTKVSGLALNKNPGIVTQKYKFAKRNYAGAKPDNTYMDVSLSFTVNLNESNSMYVFKTLRQWSDLIYNPLTGAQGLKSDYTGTIVISMFNKAGDVYRRVTCKDCFPSKPLTAMSLNYTSTDIYKVNDMVWAVDYWEDLFL